MITIRDVAKKSGVSIATVSRVINKKGKYREETERKVYRAIKELGYTVNITAKNLKTGSTGTIGIVTKEFRIIHNPELINTSVKVLTLHGFSVEIKLNKSLNDCLTLLNEGRFDGLLITDIDKDEIALKSLIDSGRKFVLLGGDIEREDANIVEIDYFQGGYIATKKLIKMGHTEILFIEDNRELFFTQEIKRGYLFALDENGIQYKETLIKQGEINSSYSREFFGYSITKRSIKDENFSAVLATDDKIAYGSLKAITETGIRVPENRSIIGFGDLSSSKYLSPPLTTVRLPVSQMGELGSEILVNNIKREDSIIKSVKLKVQLVERGTISKRLT